MTNRNDPLGHAVVPVATAIRPTRVGVAGLEESVETLSHVP